MLRRVYLKDFAVISEAEIGFTSGMTVISGETGAGKSLLVDALMFVGGARADSGVVRHGAERAELVAEFALDDAATASAWLREQELDEDDSCTLRRVIRADGGSRAWINGRPATLGQLGELGERLIGIHGQHEHQALLSRSHQLQLLDAYGEHAALLAPVRQLALEYGQLQQQLEQLEGLADANDRLAYLEHQLGELVAETLEPESIDALQADHKRQGHAANLIEACDRATELLRGDDGFTIGSALARLRGELSKLTDIEPRLADIDALLENAAIPIDEAATELDRVREELDIDPERMVELDQRLGRLHDLTRKHRVDMDQLAARRDAIAAEVDELRHRDANSAALRQRLQKAREHWNNAANKLSSKRTEAANRLGKAVSSLMEQLGMGGGHLQAALEPRSNEGPHAEGAERVELLVSANPGQPARALRKVASGGELSRISLAIEVALLGLDSVPSMVFDEVDSGIGGAVAAVVGQKLRALAGSRQVLCVTHLAQVASMAHQHYSVSKDVDGGITRSAIRALHDDQRVDELARMLGGLEITSETLAHAKQMLDRGQRD